MLDKESHAQSIYFDGKNNVLTERKSVSLSLIFSNKNLDTQILS